MAVHLLCGFPDFGLSPVYARAAACRTWLNDGMPCLGSGGK